LFAGSRVRASSKAGDGFRTLILIGVLTAEFDEGANVFRVEGGGAVEMWDGFWRGEGAAQIRSRR